MTSLFGWVQLSDLYFDAEGPDRWAHSLIFERLREDVAGLRAAEGPLDVILMTGGALGAEPLTPARGPRSYDIAKAWLLELGGSAGVGADRIFIVPGRRDVATPEAHKRRRSIARLVERLRSGAERLDEALGDEDDRELLMIRLSHYLDFAKSFAPACFDIEEPRRRLAWSHRILGRRGLALRLVGLTTALLCEAGGGHDGDRGKLQLGVRQLGEALSSTRDGELCVALSHHPFQEGWLADQGDALGWIESRAHIHLSGHGSADSVLAQRGGSRGVVRVAAGPMNDRIGQVHRYNVGAVTLSEYGALELRVWHRRWSDPKKCFVPDVDNLPHGQFYAAHPLSTKLSVKADPTPADELREDFRSRGALLSKRIQGVLSASTPSEAREATRRLDGELYHYIGLVDDDLKSARSTRDPAAGEVLPELRVEARDLLQHAQRTLVRAKLRLMIADGCAEAEDVFSCSGMLVAIGVREDAALLCEVERRWGFDFLPAHIRALEERVGVDDRPDLQKA